MTTAVPTELETAIHTLYRVFGRYHYRLTEASKNPCPHSARGDGDIKDVPVRQITAQWIDSYVVESAMFYVRLDDYKHFLPRILELTAQGHGCLPGYTVSSLALCKPDPDVAFEQLADSGWRAWPEKEREAVQAFLESFWRTLILDKICCPGDWEGPKHFHDLSVPLGSIWRAHQDDGIARYMDMWRDMLLAKETRDAALATLVALIGNRQVDLMQYSTLSCGRRSDMEPESDKVLRRFLGEPWLATKLERWFFEYEHEPFASWVSASLSFLEWAANKDTLK